MTSKAKIRIYVLLDHTFLCLSSLFILHYFNAALINISSIVNNRIFYFEYVTICFLKLLQSYSFCRTVALSHKDESSAAALN